MEELAYLKNFHFNRYCEGKRCKNYKETERRIQLKERIYLLPKSWTVWQNITKLLLLVVVRYFFEQKYLQKNFEKSFSGCT